MTDKTPYDRRSPMEHERDMGVTIMIKPLVWRLDSGRHGYPMRYRAKTHCGTGDYTIAGSEARNEWQWFRDGCFAKGHYGHKPMPIDAAKAAAQSDYESRIRAALFVYKQ